MLLRIIVAMKVIVFIDLIFMAFYMLRTEAVYWQIFGQADKVIVISD